jgi:hypothetical protein
MKPSALLVAIIFVAEGLIADGRHVEVDDKADFSVFKTFIVREGRVASQNSEIDYSLTLKTIQQAVREALSSKGLKETQDQPHLIVTFSVREASQRVVTGRGINDLQALNRDAGTLVIDMTRAGTSSPVWRGTYTDDNRNAVSLARKLPMDAKRLLSEYPPKRNR